jgi:hypothetical protein
MVRVCLSLSRLTNDVKIRQRCEELAMDFAARIGIENADRRAVIVLFASGDRDRPCLSYVKGCLLVAPVFHHIEVAE